MKKLTNLVAVMLCAFIVLSSCSSQPKEEAFVSTVANDDGTVTFRYHNPTAKEVLVDVQFAGRNPMVLDSLTGIWSATVGPAVPDIYPYCFIVDGVSVMDPANPAYFPNEGFKNSLLEIPGGPEMQSITDVPHGRVDYVKYYSNAIGAYNNALVYTPPSYSENPDRRYPVFYLISGTTDTEEVYYKVGRMNYILDNLIAQGKAQDMIIVLPYGNPAKLISEPSTMGPGGMRDYFSSDLIGDLMPYVDSNYRTIADADHRAIGGFSRGGNQGLMNGLMNLDKFSYLCSYSSFTSNGLPGVYDNAADTNSKIHLLWSGVGTDDFLYGTARDYTEFLDSKGITCAKVYTDDKFGHTWMNARYFLTETLPLLFDPEASADVMASATPTKAKTGEEQQFTPGVMARLFPKPIVSPEVSSHDVTLRIKAENAQDVRLVGDMLPEAVTMERDSDGVWSVTLPGVAPNVYCYNFIVDGTEVCDNQNMYLAPSRGFKRSVLDISELANNGIKYTPVTYVTEASKDGKPYTYAYVSPEAADGLEMPVIALVADGAESFDGWHKIARAGEVLDVMVAKGECRPVRLVMTDDVPVNDANVVLRTSDYPDWAHARQALADALKSASK